MPTKAMTRTTNGLLILLETGCETKIASPTAGIP